MAYFVTGATGFIGKFLVEKLLQREGTINVLVRRESEHKLEALRQRFPAAGDRIVPVYGDLSQPLLGIEDSAREALRGSIDHFFHVAAIYDLTASAESQQIANVEGTRNAVQCAKDLKAGCFQHVSSIAVGGKYEGTFREDMFEEAGDLSHPYFRTKHDSEAVVRGRRAVPFDRRPEGLARRLRPRKTGLLHQPEGQLRDRRDHGFVLAFRRSRVGLHLRIILSLVGNCHGSARRPTTSA